jgi:F5/8 type C domain
MSNAYMQDEMSLLVDGTNFMIAPLDMGNNRIINVTNPVYASDGANKDYVDNAASTIYLRLDGTNNMGAALNMGNHVINNLIDPTTNQQASTKKYVDDTGALMVKKDGTVAMTGNLDLGTHVINNVVDPTTNQQAATKKYVDTGDAPMVKKYGTVAMTGNLDMGTHSIGGVVDPTTAQQAATKNYVDTTASNYLKKDGTVAMTGNLDLGTPTINNVVDPTTSQQAATKNYTDTTFVKKDGTTTMTGNLNMGGKLINNMAVPQATGDGATKSYTDILTYNVSTNPTLTANTTTINGLTYIASEKQNVNVNYQPWMAFDNISSGDACWLGNSTTNSWVQLQYPYPVIIDSFYIVVRNIAGRDITSWNIQGSNDGTTFTQIMASATTLSAGVGTTITVPYYNVPYTYLRFNVVVFTGTDVGINQLTFYPRALDLNNATINNVVNPTTAQQAATKNYTDTAITASKTYLQVAPTNMTSNTAPTPYVASGVNLSAGDTYAPWRAFDGNSTTYFATQGGAGGGALIIYLGTAYVVTRLYIDTETIDFQQYATITGLYQEVMMELHLLISRHLLYQA